MDHDDEINTRDIESKLQHDCMLPIQVSDKQQHCVIDIDETDFEMHIPTMNFCGPGTNLEERLEADGVTPKKNSKPVDRIDEAALCYDIFYRMHTDARTRIIGDKRMIDEIISIRNPTCRESFERVILVILLSIKRFFTLLFFRIIDSCFNT